MSRALKQSNRQTNSHQAASRMYVLNTPPGRSTSVLQRLFAISTHRPDTPNNVLHPRLNLFLPPTPHMRPHPSHPLHTVQPCRTTQPGPKSVSIANEATTG